MVEASTRQEALRVTGDYVQCRGVIFRYAANAAQHGAVILAGSHDELQNCVVENMNASGAGFLAPHLVVRGCVFRDNGQIGFGANGANDLLLTASGPLALSRFSVIGGLSVGEQRSVSADLLMLLHGNGVAHRPTLRRFPG